MHRTRRSRSLAASSVRTALMLLLISLTLACLKLGLA
jgi:hypothetical protein